MTEVSTPAPRASVWRAATVVAVREETAHARTLRVRLDGGPALHHAGQHVVVRLTAPDGYTAARSYSIASAPEPTDELELTVERLEDGEVSPFLHDELQVGDQLEVRGPIGRWFVWDGRTPALLVGGGSGVVPLMAMLRQARRTGRSDLVRLVVSVRTPADLYYADELPGPEVTVVHTRSAPPGDPRTSSRLTATDLQPHLLADATAFVCGSTGFCDHATDLLTALDFPVDRIRVERFGAT